MRRIVCHKANEDVIDSSKLCIELMANTKTGEESPQNKIRMRDLHCEDSRSPYKEVRYDITNKVQFNPFDKVKLLVYPNNILKLRVVKKKGWKKVQSFLLQKLGGESNQTTWEFSLKNLSAFDLQLQLPPDDDNISWAWILDVLTSKQD